MDSDLLKVEQRDKATVVSLKINNVIHDDNEQMVKAFDDLINAGHVRLVLDLTETNYISSLILASFVYVQQQAKAKGGNFILCGVKARVKEILVMTNLDKIFLIKGTVDEGIGSLS
jgi:anti-anti-sigma factor